MKDQSKVRETRWEALGQRLRALRRARKLTAKEAGRLLGVSDAAWWKIEAGISLPNAWQLRQLCRAWGASADELLALAQDEGMVSGAPKVPGGRARTGRPSSSIRKTNSSSERTTQ